MASPRKQKYAEARLAGHNQSQSAIIAGYSEATARQTGSRLEKDPDVIAAKERLQKYGSSDQIDCKTETKPQAVESDSLTPSSGHSAVDPVLIGADPLKVMRDIMNDMREDPKLRLDAAKALASFTVAKPGEKGKKEVQADKAKSVASKFRNLRSVK